jgi:hypothetical protein
MGEPARKLPEEAIRPDIPGLRVLQGGGEGNGKPAGKLSSVGDTPEAGKQGSFFSLSDFANGNGAQNLKGRLATAINLHKNRRKLLIGGSVFGGLTTLIIAAFFALIPLKVASIVTNLEQHFYASINQASSKESETLLSSYLKRHVFPNLTNKGKCASTAVSRSCVLPITGNNPVSRLYDGWRQSKIENKLANKYGIEFGRDRFNNIYMKAPGLPTEGTNLGSVSELEKSNVDIFDSPQVSRSQARTAVRDALSNETRYKQVMMRVKIGKLMEEKYGVKRCVIACDARDKFSDKLATKKRAATLKVVERIIEPRSTLLGIAIKCFIDPQCTPDKVADNSPESPESNGAPENVAERDTSEALRESRRAFGGKSLDALAAAFDAKNEGKTFTEYFVKEVLIKLGVKQGVATSAGDAVPIIGWVNLAATATSSTAHAGSKVKAFRYAMAVGSAVPLWSMFQSVTSEQKSGHVDAAELGSFADMLGPSSTTENGGSGAEESPLYQTLNNSSGTGTSVASLLLPSTFATTAVATSRHYSCDHKKSVPKGKLVCPEETFTNGGELELITSAVSDAIPGPVVTLADFWTHGPGTAIAALGGVISGIAGKVCIVPGISNICDTAKSLVASAVGPIFTWIAKSLFPTIITTTMNGGRTFNIIAGGADAAANTFAHIGLGGGLLSAVAANNIRSQALAADQQSFERQPLFARMFSTDTPYSLVSRVAVAMPTGSVATSGKIADLLNPLTSLSRVFSSIFSAPRAFADTALAEDPFGQAQYGFTDAQIPNDPEAYYSQHCMDGSQTDSWNAAAAANINPDTGETQNTTTNPCLLIKATVDSSGHLF